MKLSDADLAQIDAAVMTLPADAQPIVRQMLEERAEINILREIAGRPIRLTLERDIQRIVVDQEFGLSTGKNSVLLDMAAASTRAAEYARNGKF